MLELIQIMELQHGLLLAAAVLEVLEVDSLALALEAMVDQGQ
jgi:hypothetical protein